MLGPLFPSAPKQSAVSEFLDLLVKSVTPTTENPQIPSKAYGGTNGRMSISLVQAAFDTGCTVSHLVGTYARMNQELLKYAQDVDCHLTAAEHSHISNCVASTLSHALMETARLNTETLKKDERLRLGCLAHELRNYLAVASLAHESMAFAEPVPGPSQMLFRAHHGLKEVIDRALVEVGTDEPVIDNEKIVIWELLHEISRTLLPIAQGRLVGMTIEVHPALELKGDRHLLASAVSNLVQNALKYTHAGTQVWIRAYAEHEDLVIEVEDRCGGLPRGKITEIFQPYKQADRDRGGMGLGLPIARRAIELCGGTLSAMDWPGIGCTFSIRLPIRDGVSYTSSPSPERKAEVHSNGGSRAS